MKVRFPVCLTVVTIAIMLVISQIALATTVTISGQYSTVWITPSTHEYCVQNNVWNPDSGWVQVLEVNDQNGDFTVQQTNHNKSTGGSPAAYPSIYKGNHWGSATSNSGMPIQVSNIANVMTSWNVTTIDSGVWNVAYDIWFHQTSDYSGGSPNGAELMIWINWLGNIQPAGTKVATVSLAGATWDVWFADWPNWDYIAYRITTKTTSANFDINEFIKDAISRGYIQNSWYLIDVEAGFELWQDGAGLKSSGFSVTVNSAGVGGSLIPTNKLELLILYIGLPSTVIVAAVAMAIYVKRRRKKQ
jgi:cellulose 1,4-beta-cellobiosidase